MAIHPKRDNFVHSSPSCKEILFCSIGQPNIHICFKQCVSSHMPQVFDEMPIGDAELLVRLFVLELITGSKTRKRITCNWKKKRWKTEIIRPTRSCDNFIGEGSEVTMDGDEEETDDGISDTTPQTFHLQQHKTSGVEKINKSMSFSSES